MSNRSEWNAPPTEEQIVAYARGELHGDEEARVRELLVHYPALAANLHNPSSADLQPGDDDYLTDGELAEDWNAIQQRLQPAAVKTAGRVLPFWPTLAAAAVLVLVCGGLLLRGRSEPIDVRPGGTPSVAIEDIFLTSDARRGPEEIVSVPADADLLITAALLSEREYPDYRLDIVETDGIVSRTVWTSTGLRRRLDGTFHVLVPRAFLQPGRYRLVVHGLDGAKRDELAHYTVQVAKK